MSMLFILLVIIGLVVAIGLWGVGIYNGLVRARNAFRNAFAQIDVQLQRRFDLIPNLVETAKGYLKHERETLDAVVSARSAAQSGLARSVVGDHAEEFLERTSSGLHRPGEDIALGNAVAVCDGE